MKSITRAFVYAQLLDILTTFIGLAFGLSEANPLGLTGGLVAKCMAIIGVGACLQFINLPRLAWAVVAVSALPVGWNMAVIVAERIILWQVH